MPFEDIFAQEIPLVEAANFFLKLKTASTTAELGADQFAVPVEQVLHLLGAMVETEFKTMYAYHAFAESLRDLSHMAIAEEFEDHAEDELKHAEWLMRRMSVLGNGPLQLPDIPAPPAMSDPVEILKHLIQMEHEGIQQWTALHEMMGDSPTKYEVEQYLTEEQHHLDELIQMLPQGAEMELGVQAPTAPAQPPPVAESPPVDQAAPAAPAGGELKQAAVGDKTVAWAKRVGDTGQQLRKAKDETLYQMRRALNRNSIPQQIGHAAGQAGDAALRKGKELGEKAVEKGKEVVESAKQTVRENPGKTLLAGGGAAGAAYVAGKDKKASIEKTAAKLKEGTEWMYSDKMRAALEALPEKSFTPDSAPELAKTAASAKERAHDAIEVKHEKHRHSTGERLGNLAGRLTGAVAGGAGGHALSKHLHGGSKGSNAAMLLGGAALGSSIAGRAGKDIGASHDAKKKISSALRKFAEENAIPIQQYLANEQMGQEAQSQAEADFFRQRTQEQAMQLQQAQEQQAAMQQQLEQVQQQQAQSTAQMQAVTQQAQMTQQAAMQNAMNAHQVATQATQQQLAAQDQALQQQQLAARMRIAFQEMRGNMMDLASKDMAADVGQALQQQGAPVPASPMGSMASGAAPQPGAMPPAEDPSAAVAPEAQGTNEPAGAATAAPSAATSAPGDGPEGVPQESTVKQGAPMGLMDRVPYALAGGLLGAGLTGPLARRYLPEQKQRISELEAKQQQGDKGFATALQLATTKARAAMNELAVEHPQGAAVLGGLSGAATVAGSADVLSKLPDAVKALTH